MRALLARCADLVRRRTLDRELDDEIATHLQLAEADFHARGLSRHDARQAALREFGGVTRTKEHDREVRGFPFIESLWADLRYAARGFRRNPVTSVTIVLTLALGIGATTTIFNAVDVVFLRSMPIGAPQRVVDVFTLYAPEATTTLNGGSQMSMSSFPDYVDLKSSGVLQDLAAVAQTSVILDLRDETDAIEALIVTGNYFELLRSRAALGRLLTPADDRLDAPTRVAVLSHRAWLRRFGGDPAIVDQQIRLNNQLFTVVGVAPRGFDGTELGDVAEVFVPMALQEEIRPPSAGLRRQLGTGRMLGARQVRWLSLVGRLKDGDSVTRAAAALEVVGKQLSTAYPDTNRALSLTAVPLGAGPGVRINARPILQILGIAVALVLLIACANVASLLLGRAVARRREVAVRTALGAGRGRLVRQWLTEALLLGLLGGTASVLLVAASTPILRGIAPLADIELGVDRRVFAFALACGFATSLIFGVAPILQLLRRDGLSALRDEGGAVVSGRRSTRLRSAFVVVQVALSLILLVGAGLFIRTFQRTLAVDLGYRVDGMLLANVSPGSSYAPERGAVFYRELFDRLNALSGVRSAAGARVTVLSGSARTMPLSNDGQPIRPDRSNAMPVRANVVTERYFETLGMPIVNGRNFQGSESPRDPRVAVITQALAKRLFGNDDPIGRPLFVGDRPVNVIGVVPDTVYRSATERDPLPVVYQPLSQNYEDGITLHIRTDRDPLALLPAVRQVVRDLEPRVAVTQPRRLIDEFDNSTQSQRTMALLAGALSGIALLLAAIGLYGVMAYGARQRTAEVGVRLALGSTRGGVVRLIMASGAKLIVWGSLLGLIGTLASVRYVEAQLFGVTPSDPFTWIAVATALLVVGLVACIVPAVRATQISPLQALRSL